MQISRKRVERPVILYSDHIPDDGGDFLLARQ
jgi:hypothetical protein